MKASSSISPRIHRRANCPNCDITLSRYFTAVDGLDDEPAERRYSSILSTIDKYREEAGISCVGKAVKSASCYITQHPQRQLVCHSSDLLLKIVADHAASPRIYVFTNA